MAYTGITKSSTNFNTVLYSGNGSTNAITGVGHAPDLIFIATRSNGGFSRMAYNTLRGATKRLRWNSNAVEATKSDSLTAFDSDGFTLGADTSTIEVNKSGETYVAFNWKGGTTSGITTNGTTNITPSSYTFNQAGGFSIVKWAGSNVDGAYIAHGLGKVPKLIILKAIDKAEDWQVYHEARGNQGRGWLSSNATWSTSNGAWGSFTPDTVNFRVSNDSHMNASGYNYQAFCFADIQGFQKCFNYKANAIGTDGQFVHCGFRPQFILLWNSSNDGRQAIINTKTYLGNRADPPMINPHNTNAEADSGDYDMHITSNGFKIMAGGTANANHTDGNIMCGLAIADMPQVGTNDVPAMAF
tara:strand:- start:975 stop:2045 length:1071 start_codon:yes stop_codon:yes gene_type:complete